MKVGDSFPYNILVEAFPDKTSEIMSMSRIKVNRDLPILISTISKDEEQASKFYEMIYMRYSKGYSYHEIALETNITKQGVQDYMVRLMKKLDCPENRDILFVGIERLFDEYKASQFYRLYEYEMKVRDAYFNLTSTLSEVTFDSWEMSQVLRSALGRNDIHTVAQLSKMSAEEIKRMPQIGQETFKELSKILVEHGIKIKGLTSEGE